MFLLLLVISMISLTFSLIALVLNRRPGPIGPSGPQGYDCQCNCEKSQIDIS